MSDKPTPTDMVQDMIEAAANAESVKDLPTPGTFARSYMEHHEGTVNADNVDAFMLGAAAINLLVQEAILRVTKVADETSTENSDDAMCVAFSQGINDGAQLVAKIMGAVADDLIGAVIEGPAYDRAFAGIVSNF